MESALYQILSIIGGIITIIALIRFFDLVVYVKGIHVKLYPSFEDHVQKAREEKYVGNNILAKEYYLRAKYLIQISKLKDKKKKYFSEIINKEMSEL